jgi:hypothetical protein
MLWLVAYLFLLRLPSEVSFVTPCCDIAYPWFLVQALPICKAHPSHPGAGREQSIIWFEDDAVCLRMLRRKNKPKGSGVIKRICSCRGGETTCAVHTLWNKFFATLPDGARPWTHVSADKARQRSRQVLQNLRVPNADGYGTHDLRRGHAEVSLCLNLCLASLSAATAPCQDMRKSGCKLAEILNAGQWKSAAFLKYLDEVGIMHTSVCTWYRIGYPGRFGKGHSLRCSDTER